MLRINSEKHASVLRDANNCLLVLDKVTKDYVTDGEPVRALHDVSLEVATGQFSWRWSDGVVVASQLS